MKNSPISNLKLNLEDKVYQTTKKINKESSLEDVAQEFESLFVFQMLKNARRATLADNVLTNKGTETYESLLDQEFSKIISSGQNFGIADALVRQFGKNWSPK